jgi:uncharacterized protein (DUF488 family)
VRVYTVGHGARPIEELLQVLEGAGTRTLVDVRRYPSSRRHPQFNQTGLATSLEEAGLGYRHAVELGGRRSGEPGEGRFSCIQVASFRSYAARMGAPEWQQALAAALEEPEPCFLCAETLWWRCHRRLIAELLHARGHEVVHLLKPGHSEPHRPWEPISETRDGVLYLCGERVA